MFRGQIDTIYLSVSMHFKTDPMAKHERLVGKIWSVSCHLRTPDIYLWNMMQWSHKLGIQVISRVRYHTPLIFSPQTFCTISALWLYKKCSVCPYRFGMTFSDGCFLQHIQKWEKTVHLRFLVSTGFWKHTLSCYHDSLMTLIFRVCSYDTQIFKM